MDVITELEGKLEELASVKVFNEKVRRGVDEILATMPDPSAENDVDRKVRLFVLRCRAHTLLPTFSIEAERDCNAALKLRGGRADLWVLLSECLERRNAAREACDALDQALRIDPSSVDALCRYSRLRRTLAAGAARPLAERRQFLAEAVARGHAAVRADPASADGWHCYGLALLSAALVHTVDVAGVRRALQALRQSARAAPTDPDIHFNAGAVEGLLGEFAAAVHSFQAAYSGDPNRLRGCRQMMEDNLAVLRRAASRVTNALREGRRPLATLLAKVPAPTEGAPSIADVLDGDAGTRRTGKVVVGLVDILSEPTAEPLVALAAEKSGKFLLVLFYGVHREALKAHGLLLTLSFPESTAIQATHSVPAIALLDSSPVELNIPQVYVDVKTTLVNGEAIPSGMLAAPKMSSRLFL